MDNDIVHLEVFIMGYGKNLQEAIKKSGMSVRHVAGLAGISEDTLYSIIRRDSSVRFDHALRLANILNIDVTDICKDNPYKEGEVLPEKLSDLGGLTTKLNKSTYIKNRTVPILMLFEYSEMDKVDQMLSNFYKLNDAGRETAFNILASLAQTNTDKDRKKKLKGI